MNENNPDIIFVGGSTINQKFLNYEDTIVGRLQKRFEKIKIINAGVDGMSILGHINSFELWFDKINNFDFTKPIKVLDKKNTLLGIGFLNKELSNVNPKLVLNAK